MSHFNVAPCISVGPVAQSLQLLIYRAGRSGDRIPVGRDFPPVQTSPEAHPPSCTMGTGSLPGVKYGQGVLLTTHHLPVPWSWKSRAIPLPTLWATTGSLTGTLYLFLPFYQYTRQKQAGVFTWLDAAPSCLLSAKICTTITLRPNPDLELETLQRVQQSARYLLQETESGKKNDTVGCRTHRCSTHITQYRKSLTRDIIVMPTITQFQRPSSLPIMTVYTSKSQRVESMSLFCSHAGRHFYTGRFRSKYIR